MVHESVYDEYVERAVERAKRRTVGNPFADNVEQGKQLFYSYDMINQLSGFYRSSS